MLSSSTIFLFSSISFSKSDIDTQEVCISVSISFNVSVVNSGLFFTNSENKQNDTAFANICLTSKTMSNLNPPRRRRSFYRKNYRLPLGAFSCVLIWFIWMLNQVPATENRLDLDWHSSAVSELSLSQNMQQLQQQFEQHTYTQVNVHLPADLFFSDVKKYTEVGAENGYVCELFPDRLVFRKK